MVKGVHRRGFLSEVASAMYQAEEHCGGVYPPEQLQEEFRKRRALKKELLEELRRLRALESSDFAKKLVAKLRKQAGDAHAKADRSRTQSSSIAYGVRAIVLHEVADMIEKGDV